MERTIILDPLLPWPVIAAAGALALAAVALALARGLPGWWLRALAGAVVMTALLGPSLQTEEREALTDIVVLLEDDTASSRIGDRAAQTAAAADAMAERIAARPNTEVRRVGVPDGEEDAGTLLMGALQGALSQEPRGRLAGVVAVTDGRLHDAPAAPELPAPFHVLLTGLRGGLGPAPDRPRRSRLRHPRRGGHADRAHRRRGAGAGGGRHRAAHHLGGRRRADGLRGAGGRGSGASRDAAPCGPQRHPLRDAGGRGRADRAQQRRRDPDERRARPAARAPRLGRAASGRAHLAQPPEVRLGRGSGPLHHPAPAREAGRGAGGRAVADRLPDARAVPRQDRRVRPHRVRPLPPARHPARRLSRQHPPLRRGRRRGARRRGPRIRLRRQPRALGAGRRAACASHGPGDRGGLCARGHRSRPAPSGDARSRGLRARGRRGRGPRGRGPRGRGARLGPLAAPHRGRGRGRRHGDERDGRAPAAGARARGRGARGAARLRPRLALVARLRGRRPAARAAAPPRALADEGARAGGRRR